MLTYLQRNHTLNGYSRFSEVTVHFYGRLRENDKGRKHSQTHGDPLPMGTLDLAKSLCIFMAAFRNVRRYEGRRKEKFIVCGIILVKQELTQGSVERGCRGVGPVGLVQKNSLKDR